MQEDEALDLLTRLTLEPVGALPQASNLTVLVDLTDAQGRPTGHRAVYKPVRGERPLHDFPSGTLASREVAAYLLSRAGGFDLVPPTVLREGPFGPGSVQWWVEQDEERLADPSAGLVDVFPADALPEEGWLPVVTGEDEDGTPFVIAHADDPRLRSMALLDALINNADRKAAHLTLDTEGRLRGFDHGVCLHEEDKLRSVLWGWAGDPLTETDRVATDAVRSAATAQDVPALAGMLSAAELSALGERCAAVLRADALPLPPPGRYPLPWPLW